MRLRTLLATATLAGLMAAPAPAAARPSSFGGSCRFSGPITPRPPIGVIPRAGASFSYRGTGACDGTLDGARLRAAPISVGFTDVVTLFDTCELGPDFGLQGILELSAGRDVVRFNITVDLARLALAGPFSLRTPANGLAAGLAQFEPSNPAAAPSQCLSAGVGSASLAASFTTSRPLAGIRNARAVASAPSPTPAAAPRRRPHRRHRRHAPRCRRHRAPAHHGC